MISNILFFIGLTLSGVLAWQDSPFPTPTNNETSELEPMPPEEAAATFQCPPGFSVALVAAEPDVQNPIAMTWDKRGRLWIAENYTYSDRSQRFDLSLRDRVLIFDGFDYPDLSKDNTGRNNSDLNDLRPIVSRKVFTDNVQMLTGLEVGQGGVWLMCPPQLLFFPDSDQDDVPDGPPQVMLDGFLVAQDNYHNFANGLKWGPDGWLYGRCGHSCPGKIGIPGTPDELRVPIIGGIWRFHPVDKTFEVLCHGTVNPWGHDWDQNGELFFINTVIGHLWHGTPGSHFKESFGESINPFVYQRMDTIADHYHFDVGKNWMESRDGKANDYGGGHAHVGMLILQGTDWPQQYQNKLMTINMHGMRINVDRLERTLSGYVGQHEPDLAISQDPFFRGIDLSVAPDGQVYLIDWSDTGECHEHTGVHRTSGRIFKLQYHGNEVGEGQPRLQRPLASFEKPICLQGDGELPRIWKDYQAGQLTPSRLRELADHPDESIRVWAIRLLSDRWPIDWLTGENPQIIETCDPRTLELFHGMAREDASGLVIRTLASTLQRLPVRERTGLARLLISREEFADQEELSLLVWYGLIPVGIAMPTDLVELAASSKWPQVNRWIARMLASQSDRLAENFELLLQRSSTMSQSAQRETLLGINDAFKGLRKAPRPVNWERFSQLSVVAEQRDILRELEVLFGDGKALEELRAIVTDKSIDMPTRQSALVTLIRARPEYLRKICESVLGERGLNTTALQGLALFDEPEVASRLIQRYHNFLPDDRVRVIETLVSRPASTRQLLEAMAENPTRMPATELSATQARQIKAHEDEMLNQLLSEVWGELRDSDLQRRQEIEHWTATLTPARITAADLVNGRRIYDKTCAGCHQLFGNGEHVGPDLTGAQRSSLEYLLENILDPSAVVGKEYRMSVLQLDDGRVLNGLVVSKREGKLVLRTATEMLTLALDEIEQIKESSYSAMPDGLLQGLTETEVRDLIGYLMSPRQVELN